MTARGAAGVIARSRSEPLVIGHRGAAALAPANTLASFEAALAANVDGIEFDVVARDGRAVLTHSRREWTDAAPALSTALAFVAKRGRPDLLLVVDVKRPGYEAEVVRELAAAEVLERTLVSSYFVRALRTVRRIEPRVATGIGYPADRTGLGERYVPGPAVTAGLTAMRPLLPLRIARMLRAAEADVALVHHLAVSGALVAQCHALGAPLVTWTVNDARALRRVRRLGVDALVTDDPLLARNPDGRGKDSSLSDVYDGS